MKRLLVGLLAPVLLLSGCSANAREPDSLALVRVLGVDGAAPSVLTAVSGSDSQQNITRGSSEGEDFTAARKKLPWSGEKELSLTSVSWIVVGRDADLMALLFAVLEDQEMGGTATVWLAEEGAAAVLDGCKDPAADLELLARQKIAAPTVAEALGALCTEGTVKLPTVTQRDGRLMVQGEEEWNE